MMEVAKGLATCPEATGCDYVEPCKDWDDRCTVPLKHTTTRNHRVSSLNRVTNW